MGLPLDIPMEKKEMGRKGSCLVYPRKTKGEFQKKGEGLEGKTVEEGNSRGEWEGPIQGKKSFVR